MTYRKIFTCAQLVSSFLAIALIFGPGVLVYGDNNQDDYVIYQDPNSCLKTQNQSFSTIELACTDCRKGKDKNRFLTVCPCPLNHVKVFLDPDDTQAQGVRVKCVECPTRTIAFEQRECIACSNVTKLDETVGQCTTCPAGYVHAFLEHNGVKKNVSECIQCAPGFTPSPDNNKCIPCHPSFPKNSDGMCHCPELTHVVINGICFSNTEIGDSKWDKNSVFKMEYDSGRKYDSIFLREHLLSSFLLCKGQHNTTACQLLANMCTLQLHSYGDDINACALYRSAVSEPYHHPPWYIPKLYYLNIEAPSLLTRQNLVPYQFDTDEHSKHSDLNITVSRVSVEGKFKGLASLIDVIPCEEPAEVRRLAHKFGTNFKSSCSWPVQALARKYGPVMEFMDTFLSITSNKETKLYPVPVKIFNFKQRGVRVNEVDENNQWQLVRRFFFVDAVDRIEAGSKKMGSKFEALRPVRYLSKVHVGIQLQNSYEPGKIHIPLITLTYSEIDKDSFNGNADVEFQFEIEYFMDMSRAIEDVKIAVGVTSSLTIVWAAMQAWSWNRRSGRSYIDISTIANLVIYSCGHLADAFFVVTFGASLFWFTFFKNQTAVHVLLPQPKQERIIADLLIAAFALKVVEVIKLLARQVDVDIFFIDWERPKARNLLHSPGEKSIKSGSGSVRITEGGQSPEVEKMDGNVSIWRTYFIANEWNEIQSSRKIYVAFQVIFTLFFLEIAGLKNWGLFWPSSVTHPSIEHRNIPYSFTARFAVGSLIFMLIGAVQWIIRVGILERFVSNKIQDFVDVCTLANISVFILAANQYGYYIHGRSVHGFSDTCMQTMIEQLNREEEDLCGRRGLLPSTDQQTFLISVPNSFRSVYNQVLQPLYAGCAANLNAAKGRAQLRGMATKIQMNAKPSSNVLSLSVHAYQSMNRFLTAFLEHALSDLDYDVTDKSFFEATFDMEFGDVTQDRAIFYTDNGHSFDSVLFYGNERTLFLFNLYTFIFVEILSQNFLLAGIITYLSDVLLKYTRNVLGKRNIARKTLIDGRFLI